jgi:hypothetical protein
VKNDLEPGASCCSNLQEEDMDSRYQIIQHIGNRKCQTKELTFGNEYHKVLIVSDQQVGWNPLSYYMPKYCNE